MLILAISSFTHFTGDGLAAWVVDESGIEFQKDAAPHSHSEVDVATELRLEMFQFELNRADSLPTMRLHSNTTFDNSDDLAS